MKKFLSLLLTIAIIAQMLVVPVFAEGEASASLTSDNLSGKPGETVTMTLSLANVPAANTIGIEIDSVLILDASSQWLLEDGLLADFNGEDNIATWTTDAEEGADVNGDIATLVFTVPFPCEEEVSLTCTVTLFDLENNVLAEVSAETTVDAIHIPADSVSISEDTLALDLAGTATAALSASILPEDTTDIITWASDNEAVATVDENGNVTAVGVGAANIVALTRSSYAGGDGVNASCAVTVTCSHDLEHNHCSLCGYSEYADDCVAGVVAPDGGYFYFTSLKAAVEFVHTIPSEERPFVSVIKDCTIDETITISDGINIFSSVEGENRTITVTADTAFELTDRAFLLINYLDINTTGSYIVKLTANGNGVQMSDTNLSGATASAFYVPEGVERNGIQFYGGSISAYTAITMSGNGNQTGFTIAGDGVAINVSNPEGAFLLNGSYYNGEVFGANITNSAENGVAFSLSNTSSLGLGGVMYNGVNNYWNPNYNQPSGQIIPNYGAAARVDITYYGNLYPAFEAVSEITYTNEDGTLMENAAVPVTIIGDWNTAEHFPTLTANHPIELYIAGNQNRLVLESGGILNIAQETRLHNATIYVKNGAQLTGEEYLNLEDNGHLIRESDLDANESYVAKVANYDGTYLYFESLNEAIDTVMAVPVEARPPVLVLRDCVLTETVTLDSDLAIFPAGDAEAPDFVAPTIYAGEGVDTMFNIGRSCFFLTDFINYNAQNGEYTADYIFNITSSDAALLMNHSVASGAAGAVIRTSEDVYFVSESGFDDEGYYYETRNIEIYDSVISGDVALELNGSGSYAFVQPGGLDDPRCDLTGTGDRGAIVINGDDHYVMAAWSNLNNQKGIAFTLNGDSTIMASHLNGVRYTPDLECPDMPNVGAAARVDIFYCGNVQDAIDELVLMDDPTIGYPEDYAHDLSILSDVTVTDELVLEDVIYPVHLVMNGHTITVANGGTFDIRDDMVALLNGTIYVANGGTFEGYANTEHNSEIIYEPAPENPVAQVGDVAFDTIDEALTYANSGDTITLVDNVETSLLMVTSGVTLDLNGYTLTAEYVALYKGSDIQDSSADSTGLLKVAADNIMIGGTISRMPVWTGEGFAFAKVTYNKQVSNPGKSDAFKFMFKPYLNGKNSALDNLLDDGATDNNIEIIVRISWVGAEGVGYQNFVYNEEQVKSVFGKGNAFNIIFSEVSELGLIDNQITVEAIVRSSVGVEIGSGAIVPTIY